MSEVEWTKEYYKDGTLHCETPHVNGKLHGVEKKYYGNGILHWETPYVNGQLHGVEKYYHRNGILFHEDLWIRGKMRNSLLRKEHRLERLMLLGEEG